MREFELEKGGAACLYRDNDELIDPDKDFSHLDKRIQDALGHYQKDFMGEVSADNLGARWGGYGSFLPVERCGPLLTFTRPQTHISSRSPHNPTTEVRQNPTIQATESIPVWPRSGIPPLSGQATSSLDDAVDVRSSEDAFLKNQQETVPADLSDNNCLKLGSENVIDNSAIYTGLGLDMSPSSSYGDSPAGSDGTPPRRQGLPENSPSYIIKVMTSFPVPGGKLLSPISESLVSLRLKEVNLERSPLRFDISKKVEHESVSSEGKTVPLKESKVKQISRNKLPEFEIKNREDPPSILGHPLKKMEGSKMSKGKEVANEAPASTNYTHLNKHGTSTIMQLNSISKPLNKTSEVGQLVDVGTNFQKKSHVKQEPSLEKADSLASPVASFEEKVNPAGFSEKIQRNTNVSSVIKSDAGIDKFSQTGYIEQNRKESKALKKVKGEYQDAFSSQDVGIRQEMLTREDIEKSHKQQRKVKNKVKALPDSTFQKVGAYHERTTELDRSMEKVHNDRKPSSVIGRDSEEKKKHRNEEIDIFQGKQYPEVATDESLEESSSAKNLPQSQRRANLSNRKERLSSEGKKKIRKSQEGSHSSTVLPKVSFKVGSSAAYSQQPDFGSDFFSQAEMKKEPKNVKDRSADVASNAAHKKKEKITATKDPDVGVAKREKYASGSKLKDKSDVNQYQYPSNAGLNARADPTDNTSLMDKAPTSGAVPIGGAPVVIQEDWVQCDKCHTWRLLPQNIKPDDLPKRWLCSMLTWLPGMNSCSFTEEQTQDALRALYQTYQLPPAVNDEQIYQTYPNGGPPSVVATDKQPIGITMPVTGLDAVSNTGKRGSKQEVYVKSKTNQLRNVESGNKQKLNLSRSGADKQVVIGKKREGSKDTHGALKKVKREAEQFSKDLNHAVQLATEIGDASLSHVPFSSQPSKDLHMEKSNISSKKLKDKAQPPVAKDDKRKDVPGKKRKLKDWIDDPLGTELPSEEVPSTERSGDPRKRQKLKESNLQGKDKSGGGNEDKVGRREDRPLDDHRYRNLSDKNADVKTPFRSDPELKLPALAAATSSSSKVSSSCRVKLKPRAKCSPVGSISSSPMKVSRSDHDRSKAQISTANTKQDLSTIKKNREVGIVAPDVAQHHEERADGKSKKGRDLEFQAVKEDATVKTKAHESKQKGIKLRGEGNSSPRKSVPTDQGARSFNVTGVGKPHSDNMVPERVKREQDRAGSSRDNPSSSTQVLDSQKVVKGFDAAATHDSKGELVKQPGGGKLVADDVGASSSGRKDNLDRAARTALRDAKDLKHSANRLKINGAGVSTHVYIQAALKYLQGASLSEGSGCSDMKPSEVYSSTAKLCLYCAHEFEKKNDMASAALAYKCMEVAYMRVVYADDVAASRDRQELQLAQTEVPQVESPSSSASDVDNVNNPVPNDAAVKATQSAVVHRNFVISAGNRASFVRLLNFAEVVNLAMDAARKAQNAFAIARSTMNEESILAVKRVLDFSFHDVDELVSLVRHAMED